MRGIVALCAAAGLLVSCGSVEDDETPVRATGPGDQEANITADFSAPLVLPEGFDVYPDADVVTSTDITSSDGGGTIVVMTSSDSPQDLLDYYRAQAEAAGISIGTEIDIGETQVIAGEGEDGLTFSFNVSPGGGGTTAQLAVGRGMN